MVQTNKVYENKKDKTVLHITSEGMNYLSHKALQRYDIKLSTSVTDKHKNYLNLLEFFSI